ncbi:MAG: hypothetical protein GX345_01940 [Clostridiales bacterium]|nr:hypothetical protein [Clostridiales bacterium]
MLLLFDDIKEEVKAYCYKSGLSFCKLSKMVKGSGQNNMLFQYFDSNKDHSSGLLDETPMPVVLYVRREGKKLVFEQTQYTKEYLN